MRCPQRIGGLVMQKARNKAGDYRDNEGRPRRVSGTPASGLWWLAAFSFIVFTMGGGSRSDITSLILLRPITFLFLIIAIWQSDKFTFRRAGLPLWIAVSIAAITALQLIPLPPSFWQSLPGREIEKAVLEAAGMANSWQPITMSPSRTLNAFFSSAVPITALLLCFGKPKIAKHHLVWILFACGIATAILSLLQIIGSSSSPLYLYRITNSGVAVGLFSNRNHNAIFLASLIPLLAWLGFGQRSRSRENHNRPTRVVLTLGSILFVVAMILVTGSRNGAGLAILLVIATSLLLWFAQSLDPLVQSKAQPLWKRFLPILLPAMVVMMAGITYFASRSLVIDRIQGGGADAGLRGEVLPYLIDLVGEYFPFGSGFGSFYLVFQTIEPASMLKPEYLNHAHNDILQLLIEAGLAGAFLIAITFYWFIWTGWKGFVDFSKCIKSGAAMPPAVFAWCGLGAVLAGSIFDYPLRTPSLMLSVAIMAVIASSSIGLRNQPGGAKIAE